MPASADIKPAVEARLRKIDTQLSSYDDPMRERAPLQRALSEFRSDGGAAGARAATRSAGRRGGARRRAGGRRAQRGSNVAAIVSYVTGSAGSTAAYVAGDTGSTAASSTARRRALPAPGGCGAPKGDREVG